MHTFSVKKSGYKSEMFNYLKFTRQYFGYAQHSARLLVNLFTCQLVN